MTREEEIKERMANDKAVGYWPTHYDTATYLLARNEELQREKEKMQTLGRLLYLTSREHPTGPVAGLLTQRSLDHFNRDGLEAKTPRSRTMRPRRSSKSKKHKRAALARNDFRARCEQRAKEYAEEMKRSDPELYDLIMNFDKKEQPDA